MNGRKDLLRTARRTRKSKNGAASPQPAQGIRRERIELQNKEQAVWVLDLSFRAGHWTYERILGPGWEDGDTGLQKAKEVVDPTVGILLELAPLTSPL
jgi:hypothetical protein